MAGQTLTLTIASQLQKAGFTEAAEHMRKLQNEVEGVKTKSDALTDAIGTLKTAFTVTAVVAFFKSAVDEAAKAEQSQLRLKTQVENTGMSWEKNSRQINEYTQALAKASRFTDDELNDALGVMIQRTNDVVVSQNNLQTAMGISVATGKSLAEVSSDLGAAANGNERAMRQLAREFGITGAAAKDADKLLNLLSDRFGKLATDTTTTEAKMAKFKNTFNEFKEQVGNTFLPVVNEIVDALGRLVKAFEASAGVIAGWWGVLTGVFTLNGNLIKTSLREMKEEAGRAWDAIASPESAQKIEAGMKKTTDAAKAMTNELKDAIAGINAETEKIRAEQETNELARVDRETEAYKKAMLEKYEFELKTADQRNQLLMAIDERAAAQRQAVVRKQYQAQLQEAVRFGELIGRATGRMIAGEKDAWQSLTDAIIDALVQQLQAAIIANAAKAYAKEVGDKGYVGLITGAALAGVVYAAGEVAKNALRGGGGSTPSFPSSGGAAFSGGTGAGEGFGGGQAAAPASESTVRVNIYGDMYGEPAFVDRLALKISEAVENRSVRLVSSQVAS